MRWRVALLVLLPWAGLGCLVEYVVPGPGSGDASAASEVGMTGTSSGTSTGTGTPTGGASDESDCAEGSTRCGDACVDLRTDDANCGRCEDECHADERCVGGECRDAQVLDCPGCPCPEQCPEGEGVIGSSTSGGGEDPQQYLCCVVDDLPTVLCLSADVDEALVCPG